MIEIMYFFGNVRIEPSGTGRRRMILADKAIAHFRKKDGNGLDFFRYGFIVYEKKAKTNHCTLKGRENGIHHRLRLLVRKLHR